MLKIYFSGKVDPDGSLSTNWRDDLAEKLSQKLGKRVINLDPTLAKGFFLDQNDSKLVIGRNAFFMSIADFVIVNLTDDISVGGSQEILIAKYYGKTVIGIANKDGKFRKEYKIINGKRYDDWVHPYVDMFCDYLVSDYEELSGLINTLIKTPRECKTIKEVEDCKEYYMKYFVSQEQILLG